MAWEKDFFTKNCCYPFFVNNFEYNYQQLTTASALEKRKVACDEE